MSQMSAIESIKKWSDYFGLTPKDVRIKNFGHKTAYTKNKCSIYFHELNGVTYFSYDGNAKAAYQLGLNILNNKQYQSEIGVTL